MSALAIGRRRRALAILAVLSILAATLTSRRRALPRAPLTAVILGPLAASVLVILIALFRRLWLVLIRGELAVAVFVEREQRLGGIGDFTRINGPVMVRIERLDQGIGRHAMVALATGAATSGASLPLTLALAAARRWTVLRNQYRRKRPQGEGEKGDVLFHSGAGLASGVWCDPQHHRSNLAPYNMRFAAS